MDGGAWWAAVHGVAKSWAQLSDFTFTFHFHALEKEMATHSSILAWIIPGTREPGGLLSMGSQSRTRLKRLSSSRCIQYIFTRWEGGFLLFGPLEPWNGLDSGTIRCLGINAVFVFPFGHVPSVCQFLELCQSPEGGFGGGPGQYPHLAPTYAAVNALCIIGTEEAYDVINRYSQSQQHRTPSWAPVC